MSSEGTLPVTTKGRAKRGPCGLCGNVMQLTETHIPPECAFNRGAVSPLVTKRDSDGARILHRGREKLGGIKPYLLCRPCNGKVGRYDEEYCKWVLAYAHVVVDIQEALARGETVVVDHPVSLQGRPGAFIRSALGGLFPAAGLLAEFPDLAAAILSGEPVAMPADLRLLAAVNIDRHARVQGGGGASVALTLRDRFGHFRRKSGLFLSVSEPELNEMPLALISFPPFSLALVRTPDRSRYPHADYSAWVEDHWATERTVNLLLPILQTPRASTPTTSSSFERPRRE